MQGDGAKRDSAFDLGILPKFHGQFFDQLELLFFEPPKLSPQEHHSGVVLKTEGGGICADDGIIGSTRSPRCQIPVARSPRRKAAAH